MVLIETYWNVKKHRKEPSSRLILVLIETYWNVKFNCSHILLISFSCINRNILECKVQGERKERKSNLY